MEPCDQKIKIDVAAINQKVNAEVPQSLGVIQAIRPEACTAYERIHSAYLCMVCEQVPVTPVQCRECQKIVCQTCVTPSMICPESGCRKPFVS